MQRISKTRRDSVTMLHLNLNSAPKHTWPRWSGRSVIRGQGEPRSSTLLTLLERMWCEMISSYFINLRWFCIILNSFCRVSWHWDLKNGTIWQWVQWVLYYYCMVSMQSHDRNTWTKSEPRVGSSTTSTQRHGPPTNSELGQQHGQHNISKTIKISATCAKNWNTRIPSHGLSQNVSKCYSLTLPSLPLAHPRIFVFVAQVQPYLERISRRAEMGCWLSEGFWSRKNWKGLWKRYDDFDDFSFCWKSMKITSPCFQASGWSNSSRAGRENLACVVLEILHDILIFLPFTEERWMQFATWHTHQWTDITSTLYGFFECPRESYPHSLRVHSLDVNFWNASESWQCREIQRVCSCHQGWPQALAPGVYCHVLSMWNDLFDCHLEQVDVNSVDVNLFHGLLWFIVVQWCSISSIPMFSASLACQAASLQV